MFLPHRFMRLERCAQVLLLSVLLVISTLGSTQAAPTTYFPSSSNIITGSFVSGNMSSLLNVDTNYYVVRSAGSATTSAPCNPGGYNLLGPTSLVSGTVSDLVSKNGVYMTFRSYASSTGNLTLNNGFESAGVWSPASSGGGSAAVQDSAQKYVGSYSGKTSTTNPTSVGSYAQLSQSLTPTPVSSIPNVASTLSVWLRNGGKASDNYYYVEVQVASSQGRTLHYRWNLGPVSTPSDTSTDKYITVGTSLPLNLWTQLAANFYSDWTTKSMPSSDTVNRMTLYSAGYISYGSYYGQLVNWDDVALLYCSEYTCEVEFTGSTNSYGWTQLVWTVDSAWTEANVTVTIQLYNYNAAAYPSSGDGYLSYTSSATPNAYETKTQTITVNPQSFKDGSNNWKVKTKGVKMTSTAFNLGLDWVEYKPSYYSEYTASTEFIFSGVTGDTLTLLILRVVSQYDIGSVNVVVQVWSYSAGQYATSGEGYLAYASSAIASVDENRSLAVTTSLSDYVSSGNAKIKITGVKETTTQFQQKSNQVKLETHTPVTTTLVSTVPTTVVSTVPTTVMSTVPTTVLSTVPTTLVSTVPTTVPTTVVSTVPTTIPTTVVSTVPTIIVSTLALSGSTTVSTTVLATVTYRIETTATVSGVTTLTIMGLEHITHTVILIATTTGLTTVTSLTVSTVAALTTASATSTITRTVTSVSTTTETLTPASGGRCVIASAAYGSELAPEVQLLRTFRDQYVKTTFAGVSFMKAFDAFYYSFSPRVASILEESPPFATVVRLLIYPLVVSLHVASGAFNALGFASELAVIGSGMIASTLVGVLYLTPLGLVLKVRLGRKKGP